MKRSLIKLIVIFFISGLAMVLPHNPFCSHCQQNEQRVIIFYTNDLQGILAPCG
jgi:hypothetical protein